MDSGAALRASAISASRSSIRYWSIGAMFGYGALASCEMACHAVQSRRPTVILFIEITPTFILYIDLSAGQLCSSVCIAPDVPNSRPDFRHKHNSCPATAESNLTRTEKLKQDRNQGGTGNVVVLAGQESAMRVRKGVHHSPDRIAEFLGALLSADYQRGNGDRRTSLVQHGPVAENREVVRRCMNDQLVPFPRVWH